MEVTNSSLYLVYVLSWLVVFREWTFGVKIFDIRSVTWITCIEINTWMKCIKNSFCKVSLSFIIQLRYKRLHTIQKNCMIQFFYDQKKYLLWTLNVFHSINSFFRPFLTASKFLFFMNVKYYIWTGTLSYFNELYIL